MYASSASEAVGTPSKSSVHAFGSICDVIESSCAAAVNMSSSYASAPARDNSCSTLRDGARPLRQASKKLGGIPKSVKLSSAASTCARKCAPLSEGSLVFGLSANRELAEGALETVVRSEPLVGGDSALIGDVVLLPTGDGVALRFLSGPRDDDDATDSCVMSAVLRPHVLPLPTANGDGERSARKQASVHAGHGKVCVRF
jgi:hypothetical protein